MSVVHRPSCKGPCSPSRLVSYPGFFTGLIESLFSLVQFIVMPFWGRFSDKMGRKPILIASLFSLAVTSTLFGISRKYALDVLAVCIRTYSG